jgi:ADP-ribosylglycohydrolase
MKWTNSPPLKPPSVTRSSRSDQASLAVAQAIFWLRQGASSENVRGGIAQNFGHDLRSEISLMRGGFDVSARGTVPPALVAALHARDWKDAVRAAVGHGR